MSCYLYILQNRQGRHYIGISKLNLEKRLNRHNAGDVISTRLGKPWKLIYFEEYKDYQEARYREKQIKSWKGGNVFKKFLSITAGSSNGRTAAFEAVYLGSNPSPAVMDRKK